MNFRKINSQTILDENPKRQLVMIEFFTQVNSFMSARHGYKRDQCLPFINKVDARCSKFRLTLSFYPDDSAAITAISFRDKRQGHCTALVDFVDSVSETHRIPHIRFISVMTDAMTAFLVKNKFLNEAQRYCPLKGAYVDSKDWYRQTPFGKANPALTAQNLEIYEQTG